VFEVDTGCHFLFVVALSVDMHVTLTTAVVRFDSAPDHPGRPTLRRRSLEARCVVRSGQISVCLAMSSNRGNLASLYFRYSLSLTIKQLSASAHHGTPSSLLPSDDPPLAPQRHEGAWAASQRHRRHAWPLKPLRRRQSGSHGRASGPACTI